MKKILVLEDEPNIRSFVVINLRRNGYQPIEAENGMQALSKLEENPDTCLALLDVMLPGMSGFEMASKIRGADSHVPIIFLTARSSEEDVLNGFKSGGDD